MVQPRARRVRRVVAHSSDDERDTGHSSTAKPFLVPKSTSFSGSQPDNDQNEESHSPRALAYLPKRETTVLVSSQATTASSTSTPDNDLKKKTAKAVKKESKSSKTKTLYSFFNAATQKLQERSQSPRKDHTVEENEPVDAIQDDVFETVRHPTKVVVNSTTNPKKRPFDAQVQRTQESNTSTSRLPSQKFLKATDGSRALSGEDVRSTAADDDQRPWAEKYGPSDIEELVVHKKKVLDVRQWLTAALAGQPYKRLLVLKGTAGSGKTITLSMLAKALEVEILEWKNPPSSDFLSEDYVSMSAQFDDFLSRGKKFGMLDLASTHDGRDEVNYGKEGYSSEHDKQIIVIEEFPTTILRMNTALQSFRSTLLQCLAADVRPPGTAQAKPPIVLIVSESMLSNTANSSENFTAHRLLGTEVLHHPAVSIIEFNPVAPTFISKALNLAVQKHRRHTGVQVALEAEIMRKLSEIGDVRNAISTLEFLCTQDSSTIMKAAPIPAKSRSRSSKPKAHATPKVSSGSAQNSSLSLLGLRESTIGLFHAIGKVVYNKRFSPGDAASSPPPTVTVVEPQLPLHLSHLARLNPAEVDPSILIDETGTDCSTFLSALHENYALSCFQPNGNPESTLDTLNNCLDVLGDADLLLGSAFASRGGASEGIRQEEMAFDTAVRGLLFHLPHPVKRQVPPGKGKLDAHRMFYPTGLKIWRKREEILGLADLFAARAMDGSLVADMHLVLGNGDVHSIGRPMKAFRPPSSSTEGGVETWRRTGEEAALLTNTVPVEDEPLTSTLSLGSGHSARHEMLLERLPYVAHILPRHSATSASLFGHASLFKQIEQVTRFTGVGSLQDDEDDDDEPPGIGGSVDSAARVTTSGLVQVQLRNADEELNVIGLVLSDDDIEDD